MKKLFLFIIILHSLAANAVAYDVVMVKSSLNRVNELVQHTFIEELSKRIPHSGLKTIQPLQVIEVVIDKDETSGDSAQKIYNAHPDLIVALGGRALMAALEVSDIPIVYLLVIEPEKIIHNRTDVTGISLHVSATTQFEEIRHYLPQVKRVGVVYDPRNSRKVIDQIRATRTDLQFVSLTAEKTAEVPALLNSLQGRVDLLWMLPDVTVTNLKTLPSYFSFSLQNKIPLLTFSEKFLTQGATIAVTFDLEGMAAQAAGIASDILSNNQEKDIPAQVTPQVKTLINYKIATKLHISIAEGGQPND
jgi:putative ABC transport system substrate-binding protein